jgi:hypothetical protein
MTNYRYPEKSKQLIDQSNEIPIHDEYSHTMRALEYYLWHINERTETITPKPTSGGVLWHIQKKAQERLAKGYNEY